MDDIPGTNGKPGGGAPRVPWFTPIAAVLSAEELNANPHLKRRVDASAQQLNPLGPRLVPAEDEPITLAVLERPFDQTLNFRMPIKIQPNGPNMPPRWARIVYASQVWQIRQDAGEDYVRKITIDNYDGEEFKLSPGSKERTIDFTASGSWYVDNPDASWIHFSSTFGDAGNRSLQLSFDPNPGAQPRFGTLVIYDELSNDPTFFNVFQPVEPIEIHSLIRVSDPPGLRFEVNAVNGATYDIERSSTLAPDSWQRVNEPKQGQRGVSMLPFDISFPPGLPNEYYRVTNEPAPLSPP
jgi:hypothetical protein